MIEKLCNLLKLNINAGLGRRLAEAKIEPDQENRQLYYIRSKTIIDTTGLVNALRVQAEKVQVKNVRFIPVRTLG